MAMGTAPARIISRQMRSHHSLRGREALLLQISCPSFEFSGYRVIVPDFPLPFRLFPSSPFITFALFLKRCSPLIYTRHFLDRHPLHRAELPARVADRNQGISVDIVRQFQNGLEVVLVQ